MDLALIDQYTEFINKVSNLVDFDTNLKLFDGNNLVPAQARCLLARIHKLNTYYQREELEYSFRMKSESLFGSTEELLSRIDELEEQLSAVPKKTEEDEALSASYDTVCAENKQLKDRIAVLEQRVVDDAANAKHVKEDIDELRKQWPSEYFRSGDRIYAVYGNSSIAYVKLLLKIGERLSKAVDAKLWTDNNPGFDIDPVSVAYDNQHEDAVEQELNEALIEYRALAPNPNYLTLDYINKEIAAFHAENKRWPKFIHLGELEMNAILNIQTSDGATAVKLMESIGITIVATRNTASFRLS